MCFTSSTRRGVDGEDGFCAGSADFFRQRLQSRRFFSPGFVAGVAAGAAGAAGAVTGVAVAVDAGVAADGGTAGFDMDFGADRLWER